MEQGSPLRVDALLARAATTVPDREALWFEERSWTYREVHDRARRLAGGLARLGVGPGDRVALWAPNCPEFVEVFFGVPKLGAIIAPLDFWWHWQEASGALEQLRPKVLIVGSPQTSMVVDALDAIPGFGVEQVLTLDDPPAGAILGSYQRLLADAPPLAVPSPVEPGAPAAILFTSGSTGRSKGAVHTHAGLTAAAATMALELPFVDGERTLHFLPLFSSCLEHLLPLTLVRATHVVMPAFDARAVWETVERAGVTHFDAVPTTLRRLLEAMPDQVPPSLRLVSYASERMPEQLIAALVERLPAVTFVQFYGMIEQLCLTVLEASDQLRKSGTVGRPMLGAEIAVLTVPGDDTVGEIVARGPTMFAGYWQDPTTTAQVVTDGWMRTGDLGRFDEDGFLVLEGRAKEMIKSGGMTVIPAEVEGVLAAHPAVRDVAVIGVPDPEWGEAVHAIVVLTPGATVGEAELKVHCRERLAGYKRPKVFHLVAELPRTGIGKIARRMVRDQVMAVEATERGG